MSSTRRTPAGPSVLLACPSCAGRTRAPVAAGAVTCRSCGHPLPLRAPGGAPAGAPIASCVQCGEDKFYVQKDLNQGVGCAVLAAGALLVPWTWGLSLGVCALIDWALHRLLPPLTVCYVCDARYRGVPVHPDHRPFDLPSAQTWEARRINWRRLNSASSAPSPGPAEGATGASVDSASPPP